jgi:hypothetical protein
LERESIKTVFVLCSTVLHGLRQFQCTKRERQKTETLTFPDAGDVDEISEILLVHYVFQILAQESTHENSHGSSFLPSLMLAM